MFSATIKAKLVAQETDSEKYVTYVFELLDPDEIAKLETKYMMCVRWPNWEHRDLKLGEVGYLSYYIIQAGVDRWYNGAEFIPYKYSNIQFNKFIVTQSQINSNEIIL